MLRTNGAEWRMFRAYCTDLSKDWWHEDAAITVNGTHWKGEDVADDAIMTITGGVLYMNAERRNGKSLEYTMRFWRKRSTVIRIVVEVPKAKENDIREAIAKAGGLFIG